MRILLDSCILIDLLGGSEAAREYLGGLRGAAISQLTWMEVLIGAANAEEEQIVRALLSTFELLPIDQEVSEEAVRLRRMRRLKLPDAIVFATARVHRRELATRNTKDFPSGTQGVVIPYHSR